MGRATSKPKLLEVAERPSASELDVRVQDLGLRVFISQHFLPHWKKATLQVVVVRSDEDKPPETA